MTTVAFKNQEGHAAYARIQEYTICVALVRSAAYPRWRVCGDAAMRDRSAGWWRSYNVKHWYPPTATDAREEAIVDSIRRARHLPIVR